MSDVVFWNVTHAVLEEDADGQYWGSAEDHIKTHDADIAYKLAQKYADETGQMAYVECRALNIQSNIYPHVKE